MAEKPHMAEINFKELTTHILKSYLDSTSEEDMDILPLLDESMSVIGTGKQEFFKNLEEFFQAFTFEMEQRAEIRFQWQDFTIEEQRLDDTHMLVYGSVLILGSFADGNTIIRMDSRFSIIYGYKDGIWKVLHIHHSVPDKEQMQNEEFPRTMGQQIEESQHMIMALAGDYVSVYMIDPESDRASIVKLDETILKKCSDIPESFCYSQAFGSYADSHICEEDRDKFLRVIMPDALLETFQDGRERFELNYRILKDGKQIYYSGLFVRISKPNEALKLIAGFRNTEDIVNIQEKSRKQDEQLSEMKEILANSRMGTWNIYQLEGKAPTMVCDDLMLEILGITEKNLSPEEIYQAWFSNIPPASLPSVINSVEKMKTNGRDENTYIWNHPALGERYVRCGGTAKQIEGGFVLRGYHYDVDSDVREQKKKDEALAEQVAIINTLSKNFKNVFVANLNSGMARIVRIADGYDVRAVMDVKGQEFLYDAVIKQWIQENVHPDDKEKIAAAFCADNLRIVFSRQDEYSGTYRSTEGGKLHYYQFNFKKADANGNVVAGFQVIDSIIEEHEQQAKREKELEDARLKAEKEHAEVVNSLSTIYSTIFRVNLDTCQYEILTSVPLMGEVAERIGDVRDIKDKVLVSFIQTEYQDSMREFLNLDTLNKRLAHVNTITTDYKALTGRWIQARLIVKQRADDGTVREVLYVASDITQEKMRDISQQEALAQALAAAQQANRAKTTFLNSMSHDIRTPMNAIIGFTALAQTHMEDSAQVQDYLGKISTSSTHLLSLINDILDMSRIESGTVKLEEAQVHIPDLLHDLRTMIQGLIHSKNQNLFIDTQDVIHEDVLTDKLRLNQVLLNIVGNAIKFTQPGGDIMIRLVEKPSSMKDRVTYEISVKDNGIGMSKEYLGHIFETFSREYSSTVSGIQGTGLGMAITKNIVDMMGGDIRVESELGKGSLFTVTLDLKPVGECVKNEPIFAFLGARALIVDDDMDTCRSVSKMLRDIQMRPDWTTSGKEAIVRAQDAVEMMDEYKVYIIDYLMPDMNGIETVRRIRKIISSDIPIIVLTAYDWADFEYEAREAGVTAFVSKPIFMSELRAVLTQPDKKDDTAQKPAHTYDYSGKSILLVEDNELNREIATAMLEEAGMKVDCAEDGDVAVSTIIHAPADRYDLIFMDIQMPKMDGYTATREIRTLRDNRKANIPIVAMTANAFEEDKKKSYESGMNGHIIKPISMAAISKVLDEIYGEKTETVMTK